MVAASVSAEVVSAFSMMILWVQWVMMGVQLNCGSPPVVSATDCLPLLGLTSQMQNYCRHHHCQQYQHYHLGFILVYKNHLYVFISHLFTVSRYHWLDMICVSAIICICINSIQLHTVKIWVTGHDLCICNQAPLASLRQQQMQTQNICRTVCILFIFANNCVTIVIIMLVIILVSKFVTSKYV